MSALPKVIVLAAGNGSRLRKLSLGRPKCLTPLAGNTLLDWQRKAFEQSGMKERLLVVREGSTIVAEAHEEVLHISGIGGPMDSLFSVDADRVPNGALVCYADIVFNASIVDTLLEADGDICIVADKAWFSLWSCRFDSVLDDAETFRTRGTSVVDIGGCARHPSEIEAQFIGMIKLSPRGFEQLRVLHEPGDDCTRLLDRAIRHGLTVTAVFIEGRWCEVDSPEDVSAYHEALGKSEPWIHDWRED